MKKILMWLTVLALMLTGAAFADQENAPVMLVKLPEDAQMVENVAFDDGDFIQTYQLSGGAYVQLLRYAQGDVTLDGIVAGDWPGATDIQSMALETVGGYAAKGLMLSVEPEDEAAQAHMPDESCPVESVRFDTQLIAEAIKRLAGK